MILQESYTLSNGVRIPKLGLGTWFIEDGAAAQAVRDAVQLGYRLIDTAQAYGNERGVGEGVRSCGLARGELFVASKVAAELKTYDEAARSIDETLEKMGLDYLDQMIIHSPQPWSGFRAEKRYFEENRAVWRALEDAQAAGKVRVIGVSNFLRDDLENLLADCRVKPMVNQILLHIGCTDAALLDFCRRQEIQIEAYSPIAHGEALKNLDIVATASARRSCVSAMPCSSVRSLCRRPRTPRTCTATPRLISPSPTRIWRRCGAWSACGTMASLTSSRSSAASRWRKFYEASPVITMAGDMFCAGLVIESACPCLRRGTFPAREKYPKARKKLDGFLTSFPVDK